MTRAELVNKLEREGYHTIADYVRHGYLPGETVATLDEIRRYCLEKGGNLTPYRLIGKYQKERG